MQGNIPAVFVEVKSESTFFSPLDNMDMSNGTFPRLLSAPLKFRTPITESAVEKHRGFLYDTEEFWVLLHLLVTAHPCTDRRSSDKKD